MRENFAAALRETLRHEGGYSNHPDDAGGATNFGIIQRVYDGYRRRQGLIPRSVKLIAQEEVEAIYRLSYWAKVEGDALPRGVDFCVFDAAVNSGPGCGARWLQQAVNDVAGRARLAVDGNIGPATLDASDDYPADKLIQRMVELRLGFMRRAVNTNTGKPIWPIFGAGWSNRVLGELADRKTGQRQPNGVLQVALRMAREGGGVEPAPRKVGLPVPVSVPSPTAPVGAGWVGIVLALVLAAIMGVLKWMH